MAMGHQSEVRIFTPIGMLGYGYNERTFWSTVDSGVDAIILDSGSTDGGPAKLALSKSLSTPEAYMNDLAPIVAACHYHHVPVLIGSAGGDGSNRGVKQLIDIIKTIVKQEGYRPLKILSILAEIDKEAVHQKHDQGLIVPCGPAVPDLIKSDIDEATTIVAQMGIEPWLKAFEQHPDFDIIIGGRAYDPAPYAAFCVWKGLPELGLNYHMGKIMECGAVCATPKSREALAVVRKDSFDITPLNPRARCTKTSVAAHTLYEKSRPDILVGPGGSLDLTEATYEELEDGRSVRCKGAKFRAVEPGKYTIKLEGGKPTGYFSMFIGGFRDPILLAQLDTFLATMRKMLASMVDFEHELDVRLYGQSAVMGQLEPDTSARPHEVGIMVRCRAPTQEQATHAMHMARVYCMHGPYTGQKATAGNFAMPSAPLDIPMGPTSEFCLYHLMTVFDPSEHFPVFVEEIEGTNTAPPRDERACGSAGGPRADEPDLLLAHIAELNKVQPKAGSVLGREAPAGSSFLADLASIVRSKNAGPYELTFDVMFADGATRDKVKRSGVLCAETIAKLYNLDVQDVLWCGWWDPALAFKATIKRPHVSGGFGESDAHGSAQHAPLMSLLIPVEAS